MKRDERGGAHMPHSCGYYMPPSGLRLIALPYFYYYHSKNHYAFMITKAKEKFLVV
jgi:hypothetical protein